MNGLRSGDFDFACDMPPDQIVAIDSNPKLEVVGGPIMNIRLTIFDKHHPVLKDPRVRRAMTHAVDRQAIVDALWSGRTKVPKGLQWDFLARCARRLGAAGFRSDRSEEAPQGSGLRRRADPLPDAEQLLHQPAPDRADHGRAVEGRRAQCRDRDEGELGPDLGRFPGRGICENSNSSWFNDPVASLSAYAPGGQTWEAGQWENDEMIKLTAALQDSTDLQKRRADFRRMLTILEREDPCYNVVHQNATFTAKRRDYKMAPGAILRRPFPGEQLGLKACFTSRPSSPSRPRPR